MKKTTKKEEGGIRPIFFNRELSWLDFNQRVLEEASFADTPVLEKVKFLTIFSSNLDEFFMVRVAGLKKTLREHIEITDSPDDLHPREVLRAVKQKTDRLVGDAYEILFNVVVPGLEKAGIRIEAYSALPKTRQKYLTDYFHQSVFPVLTPLAVDPAHPIPFLSNLKLYLLVSFEPETEHAEHPPLAFVEIPEVLPRLVPVSPESGTEFVFLEDLIAEHLESLFLGFAIQAVTPVKITRDLDFTLLENEVVDLLASIEKEVKNREQSEAVRLEVSDQAPDEILQYLKKVMGLKKDDVYLVPGPVDLKGFASLCQLPLSHHKDPPFNPRIPPQFKGTRPIFTLISEQDLIIHHPYESFYTVVEFLSAAAQDPGVLAIKQTLYRTSGDSPVIDALIQAAENGKHVTAVVELKARFDESNNIVWARRMERSGVNVVYGFVGLKTHGKVTLVVRKEGERIKRYVHFSTGNYNSATARTYVDIGLMTANPGIGHDISTVFNLLTGFNILTNEYRSRSFMYPDFREIALAPLNLRESFLTMIERETAAAREGGRAEIIGKMNALVDRQIIEKLYEASNAGVRITLLVRGVCCLVPGVPGMSKNIKVLSILDRFLEHSRIYLFHAGGQRKLYLSSADWMPRNMERRVEILLPVLDGSAKERIEKEILGTYLRDNVKARYLDAKGNYRSRPVPAGETPIRCQQEFIDIAREQGLKSIPYEKAIRHNPRKRGMRPLFQRQAPRIAKPAPKRRDKKNR